MRNSATLWDIVKNDTPQKSTFKSTFKKAYRHAVNRFDPIETAVGEAKKKGAEVAPGEDPALQARRYLGVGRIIESTLSENTFTMNKDGNVEVTGEGLKPILDNMDQALSQIESKRSVRKQDFSDFLIARRMIEDLAPMEDVTITDEQMRKSVRDLAKLAEKYGESFAKFEELSQRVYGFQDRVIQNELASGQLSQEQYDEMRKEHQHYVPFQRDLESGSVGYGGSGVFTKSKTTLKKIKGSELDIHNPLDSIIINTAKVIKRSMENRVATGVANLADTVPHLVNKLNTTELGDSSLKDQIKKLEKQIETEQDEGTIDKLNDELLKLKHEKTTKLMEQSAKLKGQDNVIEYYENGERLLMEVDSELYEAMAGMPEQQMGIFVKLMAIPASLLRVGATITPDFMISNFIRDQFTAGIQAHIGFKPFIDPVMSISEMIGKNGEYQTWLRSGGAYASLVETTRENSEKSYDELTGHPSLLKKMNIISHLSALSQFFEEPTRLAMFKAAKRSGKSDIEAGFESREGTLDFSRRGSSTKQANAMKAFFNVGIQSFDKTIRIMKANPIKTTVKGIAYITTPSVLLFLHNKDDEEYWELPQWRRDLFWNLKVDIPQAMAASLPGVTVQADGTAWLSIPKPFGLGQVFGTIPERFMQHVFESDPHAFRDLSGMLSDSVLPMSSVDSIFPTAFVPVIEGTTNYNFFTGRDIVPEYKTDRAPFLQYNKGTSETAKELGKALDMAPAKIDNTIRGYLGSAGKYTLEASDALVNGIKRSAGETIHEKPSEVSNFPFLRRFVKGRPFGYKSESVQRFYDLSKELAVVHNTANTLKNNEDESSKEYRKENKRDLVMYKQFTKTKKRISKLGNEIDIIIKSDSTDSEKLKAIEQSERKMTQEAKNMLDEYEGGR